MFPIGWQKVRQKDARTRTVSNYIPIACLNLLWKLLTGIINEKGYDDHLNQQKLLPEKKNVDKKIQEQKISS